MDASEPYQSTSSLTMRVRTGNLLEEGSEILRAGSAKAFSMKASTCRLLSLALGCGFHISLENEKVANLGSQRP